MVEAIRRRREHNSSEVAITTTENQNQRQHRPAVKPSRAKLYSKYNSKARLREGEGGRLIQKTKSAKTGRDSISVSNDIRHPCGGVILLR
jgi:hypothetical protein